MPLAIKTLASRVQGLGYPTHQALTSIRTGPTGEIRDIGGLSGCVVDTGTPQYERGIYDSLQCMRIRFPYSSSTDTDALLTFTQ